MKTLPALGAILAAIALSTLHAKPPVASEGYQPVIKVIPLLRTTETVAGQPIEYPKTSNPEVTAVHVTIPPGAQTGWHRHPFPCYGYILSGHLNLEMEGGKTKLLSGGQALAESVNVLHNGVNLSDKPVEIVMFVTGEKGQPFTVPGKMPK